MDLLESNSLINNRYQLLAQIGAGATSRVFSAWDHQLEREVAVKVLHDHLRKERQIIARFDQEIRVSGRLNHPGLVAVYETCDLPDQSVGYVMALLQGRTLAEMIDDLQSAGDHWEMVNLVDRLTLVRQSAGCDGLCP